MNQHDIDPGEGFVFLEKHRHLQEGDEFLATYQLPFKFLPISPMVVGKDASSFAIVRRPKALYSPEVIDENQEENTEQEDLREFALSPSGRQIFIPLGWMRVRSGKTKRGDMMALGFKGKFIEIDRTDVGHKWTEFFLIIRKS